MAYLVFMNYMMLVAICGHMGIVVGDTTRLLLDFLGVAALLIYRVKEFKCHLVQQEGISIGYNKEIDEFAEAIKPQIALLEELEQYRAIGTIEEFKDLKEKSVARKIRGTRFEEAICPRCESELFETYWAFGGIHYCSNCGQAIDWQ